MKFALINNIKSEAVKNQIGLCDICGKTVMPKCGDINVHHWAHSSVVDCDSWKEPETLWHRNWKNKFPLENQEIVIGKHRADVHIDGLTIEFQHSPISIEDIHAREYHYENLIWVVDAIGKNIEVVSGRKFIWKHKHKCWWYHWKKNMFLQIEDDKLIKIDFFCKNPITGEHAKTFVGDICSVNDFMQHVGNDIINRNKNKALEYKAKVIAEALRTEKDKLRKSYQEYKSAI